MNTPGVNDPAAQAKARADAKKKRRLYECPPCPTCGHERGFKLRRRRSPQLAAIKERWQCASWRCGEKFTSWSTTKEPARVKNQQRVPQDGPTTF